MWNFRAEFLSCYMDWVAWHFSKNCTVLRNIVSVIPNTNISKQILTSYCFKEANILATKKMVGHACHLAMIWNT